MARTSIEPIQSAAHLKNAVKYIHDRDKTDWFALTDSYKCCFSSAEIDFEYIRDKEVIKKGVNIAWHLHQDFSPDDNVTPEQALEIGKELMRRMYPNYQYVIATHIDKGHIHNHIILNSVNFVDYHKLVSNFGTLKELRRISDEICRENNLSVIQSDSKKNTRRLAENIDKAIEESPDFDSFIAYMQELGYEVKLGSKLKFKDDKMEHFISSKSISQGYSEDMIKYRIANKDKDIKVARKRTRWDDKIKVRSKTQLLKHDIDSVLKTAQTYTDFINQMKDRGYEIKQGEHLAFKKLTGGEEDEKSRFRRSEKIGLHYTEEVIKWRINHREEYEKMSQERKIEKVITVTDKIKYGGRGLSNWAAGENSKRGNAAKNWIIDNLVDEWLMKNNYNPVVYNRENSALDFAVFLEYYDKKKEALDNLEKEVAVITAEMKKIQKTIKSVEQYFILKPTAQKYVNVDYQQLSDAEKSICKSVISKYNYHVNVINEGKEFYGTLSMKELWQKYNSLKSKRVEMLDKLTKEKLDFDTYETVKYNMEHEDGICHCTREEAEEHMQYFLETEKHLQEKIQKKENRKKAVKDFFGLD